RHLPYPTPLRSTDAESDGVGIHRFVSERQLLRIPIDPVEAMQPPLVNGAVLADAQHRVIDVEDGDMSLTADAVEKAEGDIAGAAGNIEKMLSLLRHQPVDHRRFPQPMDAGAHQIIHQIVAAGNAVENAANQPRLLLPPDFAKAKMGAVR